MYPQIAHAHASLTSLAMPAGNGTPASLLAGSTTATSNGMLRYELCDAFTVPTLGLNTIAQQPTSALQ